MADTVKVRFLADHGAFKKGEEHEFFTTAIDAYGDAIELVDPPAAQTSPNGSVEYDRSVVNKLEARVLDLRAKLDQTDLALVEANQKLATANARVAELEATVSAYASGQPVTASPAAPQDVASQPGQGGQVVDPAPPAPAITAEAGEAGSEATGAPAAAQPAASQAAASNTPTWRDAKTASLGIPASLKGLLLKAGLDTAGKVSDGLEDGSVQLIEGIGEAKVTQLREHIASLAK